MFQLVEGTFDQVAFFVKMPVVAYWHFSIRSWRNDRFGSLLDDRLSEFVAVITFIGKYVLCRNPLDQSLGALGIMNFAARQFDSNGIAERIDRKVDLGAEAAFGSSQRLSLLPPFAPAAER